MTEDTSPENLRKFLESDDPAMVRMGISLAKGAGIKITLKDLAHFLKSDEIEKVKTGVMLADEAGIGSKAMTMLSKNLFPSFKIDWDAAENDEEYGYGLAEQIYTESCKVAKRLGGIGDKRAVKPLIKLLNGKIEPHMCCIVDEENVRDFISDIKDMVFETITAAAEALGEIGDKQAVKPLITSLESDEWRDFLEWGDMDIWLEAIKALGNIGDERAVKPLKKLLENEEIMEIAMDRPFQWTLAEIRDPQSAYNNPNRERSNPMRVAITEALEKLE